MPMTAVTATFGMSEFSTVESVDLVMASAFLEIVGEATAWISSGMTLAFGFSTPLGAVPSSSGWCKARPQSRLPLSRSATEAATVMAEEVKRRFLARVLQCGWDVLGRSRAGAVR